MVALPSQRVQEIVELAEGYADAYFPASWIDPAQLLDTLGVTISYNDYGNAFDGLLEWKAASSSWHIYCNLTTVESSTSVRARFTLGHELGHLLIDEHRIAMMSGNAPSQHPSFSEVAEPTLRVEAEADLFSSSFLMPPGRLEKVIPAAGWTRTFDQVLQVQSTFTVSFQSAALKVIDTAKVAFCAGVMWRTTKKPWYRVSEGFQKGGYRHIKLDKDNLPAGCATASWLADENMGTTLEPRTNTTTAAYWFQGVQVGSRHDIPLRETAVRLGPWGVFTFLSWELQPR